jgi:hypothetical protein
MSCGIVILAWFAVSSHAEIRLWIEQHPHAFSVLLLVVTAIAASTVRKLADYSEKRQDPGSLES